MKGPDTLSALALHGRFWLLGACLAAAALIETWRPERARHLPRGWRWATNLGVHILSDILVRVIAPYALALWLLTKIGGPHFQAFAPLEAWGGPWAVLAASCLLLDLTSYLLHRLQHAVFPLWRLHAVHHADIDVDATTAVRHHPFEAAVNAVALLLLILVIGMPPGALPVYAAFVLAQEIFVHANVRMPPRLDAALGLLFVTPGLHRTHHAASPEYFNANFGTVLSIWDRAFRTLMPPLPAEDPPGFGVAPYLEKRYASPFWALVLPFVMRPGGDGLEAPPPQTARTPPDASLFPAKAP